ncbi:pimeloyl-ACP methyl ester carboxylesterase [Stella humosa]|uniref:Pimeloyl-ACP methyl ester carboxylesterase n=1 Tax=Stella humosa TaxID=94 RepID=A0A3N1MEW1_9PROT|nr:alpha/beta hydrolase [Stella humosa]ROQ01839.1 pimeloyl-ACP methyl ester carboxylesterase [Stella humosa]BBK32227.1 haloalkane dehalogenase [Stella humosa]
MIEVRNIETAPGLVFDVSVAGPEDGEMVLMLHGFVVSRHYWNAQVEALAAAGYRAVAPNQRGYAAGARPDTNDFEQYRMERLIKDAFDIVDRVGKPGQRFHLVGHDWGGSLSWEMADQQPERIISLSMLSRPHPQSFLRAMALPDGVQAKLSGHHTAFLDPAAGDRLMADNAKWMRDRLTRNGVPPHKIEEHMGVLGNRPALEAALAWYRARGVHQPVGPTKVPTLFIWGDADDTVGRVAAEGTAEFIDAPYTFIHLPGVGHYAADQVPDKVNAALLAHMAKYPA